MKSWVIGCLLWIGISPFVSASNVKINGEITVISIDESIVTMKLNVSWDNSWRNVYNYDAVYLFGKFHIPGTSEWHTVYLAAKGAETEDIGYETFSNRMGIFVYRKEEGQGKSDVNVILHWDLKGNARQLLEEEMFRNRQVLFTFEGIEMVYVPTAPFYAGDGRSVYSFSSEAFGGIPAGYDLIGTNANFVYTASANSATAVHAADRKDVAIHDANYDWAGIAPATWQVDFKTPRKILYFGVSGEYEPKNKGVSSKPKGIWYLEGSNDASVWEELWKGNAEYWGTAFHSYPIASALKLERTGNYRYYRIRVPVAESESYGNTVRIHNVAMSEKELEDLNKGRALVDVADSPFPPNYPDGYGGFYAMKYELSQEQYVAFLNKLNVEAQYARTIGGKLDLLGEDDYVFGPDQTRPENRNGIIVHKRTENAETPLVFACNLNPENLPDSEDDGQTIACNFLSPQDMLAYADWAGLRPLSELEYEKMSRSPYPSIPKAKELASGKPEAVFGYELKNPGKNTEYLSVGNLNAGKKQTGPVRVGSFLKIGKEHSECGISYWGIEDLSGNLAEIYYNSGVYGRQLDGTECGDGELETVGITDVAPDKWPQDSAAFGIRGGSYESGVERLAVSDRQEAIGYFVTLNERKPAVGFRLGYPIAPEPLVVRLILENGLISEEGLIYDTVCSNANYTIRGNVLGPAALYTWYCSKDYGDTWELLEGETHEDLLLKDLTEGIAFGTSAEYRYRRCVSSPFGSGTSTVALTIGHGFKVNRMRDTLIPCQEIKGFVVRTPLPSLFRWRIVDGDKTVPAGEEDRLHSSYKAVTSELRRDENWPNGLYYVDLKVSLPDKRCEWSEQLEIIAIPQTLDPFEGIEESYMFRSEGYLLAHRWTGNDPQQWELIEDECERIEIDEQTGIITFKDITVEEDRIECHFTASVTCKDYPDRTYTKRAKYLCRSCLDYYKSGMRVNGNYMIDPDGPGKVAPYSVYCDMANGGWTRFDDISNGWQGFPGNSVDRTINRVTNYDRFVALASVSEQQKLINVQGSSERSYDYYYFLNYYGECISGLPCNVSGGGNWGNVIVPVNKVWRNAMYKSRFRTDGSVNGGAGTYFQEMWFK